MLVVLAVVATLGREEIVRPEIGLIPMPEGAVVRYHDARCPSPEIEPGPVPICDALLAVSPLAGLELPGPTEEALAQHLRAEGWTSERDWLLAPDSSMRIRVESLADVAVRDPDLAAAVEESVSRGVELDDLAVLTALPDTAG